MSLSKISRYELKSVIGRGGMAMVYLGHDPRFKRDVAVKVMSQELLGDPTLRARFEREAQTIASLEHPAIVPVYDFGEDGGRLFLVMRLMTGGTLANRLDKGLLPISETITILQRIGSALERAHGLGIIHRDLKPSNIMFDQYGDAFLADFGIAQLTSSSITLTGQSVIGTPAYMSPEQIYGDKALDGRSDIYALGVICFEMLTGHKPYEESTPAKVMMKHVMDPVPNIRDVKPDLPLGVDTVISRTMAKDPKDRFKTPRELTDTLAEAARGESRWPADLETTEVAGPPIEPEATIVAPPPTPAKPQVTPAFAEPTPVTEPSPAMADEPVPETEVMMPVFPEKPAAERRRPRRLWLAGGILGVVGLVVIVAVGVLLLADGGSDDDQGTDRTTPVAEVAEATAAVVEPEVPPTNPPEDTATPRPTRTTDPRTLAESHMDRFYEHLDSGELEAALMEVNQAIDLVPDESWYFHERGYIYELMYDYDAAIADYSHAIRLAPDDSERFERRGSLLREMGEYEAALEDHQHAVELDRRNPYAHLELAVTLMEVGDHDRAIDEFTRAIELGPGEPDFYQARGDAFYTIGDLDAAIADYSQAIKQEPDSPWPYAGRYYVLRDAGDLDGAIADINRAIELGPEESWLYMERGYTFMDWLEDPDAAVADFSRAIELDPENPEGFSARGFALKQLRQPDAALEDFAHCLDLQPDYYWCHWEKAWIYSELGDVDAAREHFAAFLDLVPDDDCTECQDEARRFIAEHGG